MSNPTLFLTELTCRAVTVPAITGPVIAAPDLKSSAAKRYAFTRTYHTLFNSCTATSIVSRPNCGGRNGSPIAETLNCVLF